MIRKYLPALAAIAVLGACTTATPYQAATPDSSLGYTNQQIETNRWMVSFSGNSLTDRQTVDTYLLYRSAELTSENGYDYFRMVQRATDSDSDLVPVGGTRYYSHFNPYYRYWGPYGRPLGWGPYGDPWDAPEYRQVTRYEATAEIIMGKGEKPDDPAYYSAEEVLMNLAGNIARPQP